MLKHIVCAWMKKVVTIKLVSDVVRVDMIHHVKRYLSLITNNVLLPQISEVAKG